MFKLKNLKILLLLLLFAFAGNDAWGNNWWCYQIEVDVKLVTGEGLVYDPDPGEIPGTIEVGEVNNNHAYARSDAHNVVENNIVQENRFYFQQHSPNLNNGGKGDEWVMKSAVPNTQNPNVSYIFKGWMYAGNAGDGSVVKHVSGNNATFNVGEYLTEADYLSNIGGYAFYAKTQHKCAYSGEHGVSTDDGAEHVQSHIDNPPVYTNDAIIYALFEKQELTPAVTIQYDLDKCEVEYPVDYQTNAIGNTITVTARRKADTEDKGWEKEFVGWADEDGNIVSTDNPWTLNIEKKAVYRAVIEDRYRFFRIKNYGEPHRYVSAISDEASSNNFMDLMDNIELLQLIDNKDKIIYDAGSIVQIDVLQNPYQSSATYVDLTVQNSKASKYYIFDAGVTINSLPYDYITKTWNFKAPLALFRDDSGVPKMQAISDNYSKWIIEHIDLDLETKENYFSLDPAKLVQVGDKYYTTLRTSWNILYNPEQMTPYVVTSVDEETGTFEMEPITGNIIPLGTPVIIETKSTSIEENRMVPTTTAFTGTKPATNLLTTSDKYFPNQSVSGNYKALMVNGEGQLAFGGNALTTVNGNEAYLQVANDVALKPIADLPTLATLKAIESTGEKGKLYTVEDGLVAVAFAVDEQENCALLWCKDQAESNAKTEVKTGQTDYMKNQYAKLYNSPAPEKWDQSNWVAVKLVPYKNVGLSDIATRLKNDVVGHVLKPKAVTGTYSDDVNYTIAMAMPEQDGKVIFENMIGDAFTYNENLYCTANFLSENLVDENGVTQSATAEHYYFVNPKIQEVAEVTFAVWNGSYFVAPAPQEGTSTNESEINGAFNVDWRYNSYNINTLASNKAYQFMAVVQKPVAVAGGMGLKDESEVTPMDCTPDGTYMVFPLNLDPSNKDQVITSIARPVVSKTMSRVMYYNLMGVASAVPFQGVNIVVTEYSDGSRQARKVVMK